MTRFFLTTLALFFHLFCNAQIDTAEVLPEIYQEEGEPIVLVVAETAVFEGDFAKFIIENLKYPKDAAEKKIEGKVFIAIVIEKNGTISDVRFLKGLLPSMNEEAMRIIRLTSGKWKAAKNNGVPVRFKKTISIEFRLSK